MPIVSCDIQTEYTIGIWKITESIEDLIEQLPHNLTIDPIPSNINLENYKQKIASRLLIHKIISNDQTIVLEKSSYGKLYIKHEPSIFISISHTKGYATAIFSKKPVGIDIETKFKQIEKISSKFINDKELEWIQNSTTYMSLIWGAKESIYKIFEKKELDFKKHLTIIKTGSQIIGHLKKEEYEKNYNIQYKINKEYILVWAFE